MSKRGVVKHVPLEPIRIGCFTLTETGMEVEGSPSFSEYQGIGDFISRAHKAAGWWVADWLRYGESRKDFKENLEAVLDVTGYEYETAMNLKSLGENVAPSRRRADVDISKHFVVAKLSPKEQAHWLDETASRGLSVRELRNEIRAAERVRVLKGQAHLEGKYRVIYADPPWTYGSTGDTASGALAKAEKHYPTMTIEALCQLPVREHVLENSVLFLWVTAPLLSECWPVIDAWGFTYKTGHVWDKVLGNYGHYSHVVHEHLLVCTRGSCLPDAPTPSPKSVTVIRRSNEHSAKPDEFRKMIEQQYTIGPYLELFGRKPAKGWSVFGNDPRLWAEQAKPPVTVPDDDVPF